MLLTESVALPERLVVPDVLVKLPVTLPVAEINPPGGRTGGVREGHPVGHPAGSESARGIIDVGAPVLRYAHARAVKLGVDVNFRQALAEDMPFEDGSFDHVFAYILFHEVPIEVIPRILADVRRILRPGGTFVTKAFQGGEMEGVLLSLKRNFAEVKHVKPKASRAESSEVYLVATGFKGR